jgi:hypothetical protein
LFNTLGPALNDVHYQYFDFHRECAHMRWDNIDKLLAAVRGRVDAIRYTSIVGNVAEVSQTGVVRTNCIDCLDRTNVVQSMLARQVLEKQLQELGIGAIDCLPEFRNVWADNADIISLQYAGTKALKTDFTRTGKRSVLGALADGVNAVQRFYVNTVTDGDRQDAVDAVTQTIPCVGYKTPAGFLHVLIALFQILILFVCLVFTRGAKAAKEKVRQLRVDAVNRPQFRDVQTRK